MKRTLFLVLLLLAACSRSPAQKSVETESNRTEAAVSVVVSGAETYRYEGRTTIIVFRTLDKRVPEGLRLFSVGIPDPGVKIANGFFRTAFDVLGFKGDGNYTIGPTKLGEKPEGPLGLRLPSGIQSNAFVQWFRPDASPPIVRYDVALESCSVRSKDKGREGTLQCPSIRQDNGTKTVRLDMTWDAR